MAQSSFPAYFLFSSLRRKKARQSSFIYSARLMADEAGQSRLSCLMVRGASRLTAHQYLQTLQRANLPARFMFIPVEVSIAALDILLILQCYGARQMAEL